MRSRQHRLKASETDREKADRLFAEQCRRLGPIAPAEADGPQPRRDRRKPRTRLERALEGLTTS